MTAWCKRHRKGLIALGLALLLAAISPFALSALVVSSTRHQVVEPASAAELGADCVLVLGAGVTASGYPSPMLEDRLLTGISLYQAGAAPKLLMSGDHGRKGYDEVNVMKDFALARDLPSSDVFMDHAGFATYDSLYRARDVFAAQRVVIVSQQYHLYRALYIANALGLDAVGVAADLRTYPAQDYYDLREVLARCKDAVKCLFRPEPTFLGEVIPVSGDGDLTNDRL